MCELPGGTPLTATSIAELGSGGGVGLPVPAEGASPALKVKAWLAPDAPPSAFGGAVSHGVAITAETRGGSTFTVKEKLG